MNDVPPNITTLESMGILLWHLQQQITRMESQQHTDIKALRETIATLASKQYVDEKLVSLRDEVNRGKPATLFANVVKFCAGVAVSGLVWFAGVSAAVSRGKGRFSVKLLRTISRASGIVLLITAVVIAVRLVQLLAKR